MPLNPKELPFEVEDHVTLDKDIFIYSSGGAALVVLAGTHGMVKKVAGGKVYVEFGSLLFDIDYPAERLTLFRRSQDSKKRK
jgi:hypothetical protein